MLKIFNTKSTWISGRDKISTWHVMRWCRYSFSPTPVLVFEMPYDLERSLKRTMPLCLIRSSLVTVLCTSPWLLWLGQADLVCGINNFLPLCCYICCATSHLIILPLISVFILFPQVYFSLIYVAWLIVVLAHQECWLPGGSNHGSGIRLRRTTGQISGITSSIHNLRGSICADGGL